MFASVFTKTLLDRWRGVTIGVLSLALLLIFAMAVYRDLDSSLFDGLPAAVLTLIGIPEGADLGVLAYTAIYSSYGALTLAGIAIAMGASSIAGEERTGTIGVLLGNPTSRTSVAVSKALALLLLFTLGGLVLWGAGELAPVLLDVNIADLQVGAYTFHMTISTIFYGMLAFAIGAWTGRSGPAAAVAAGLMVVSFFAVGLLPSIEGWADAAKFFPWYYLAGGDPLANGIIWSHISLLGGLSLVFFAAAIVGVNRRDLHGRSTGVSLIDRLRAIPITAKLADRFAGSTRVSAIWVKSATEHQTLLIVISLAMFWVMGVLIGPIYNALDTTLSDFANALPEAMLAFFGGGDLTTPEGYYQVETLGMVAPIAIMTATITLGAKAVAGEEANRTIGLLLANPISRRYVLAQKTLTMIVYGAVVGLATFLGIAGGNAIANLGISYANIAATCLLLTLLGLLFGGIALLLSGATGLVRVGVLGAAGLAVASHVLTAMADLNDASWRWISPFTYYLGSDPMVTGLAWQDAAVLSGLTIAVIALAFPAFARRDLRQHS